MFAKGGQPQLALEMFSDLRQFDEARAWADSQAQYGQDSSGAGTDVGSLAQQQAEWSEQVRDYRAAAEMYMKAGKVTKAVQILGGKGMHEQLLEVRC